jgi:hypothetical protein
MKKNMNLYCVYIIVFASLTGCRSYEQRDSYQYQPYKKGGEIATGWIVTKPAEGIDLIGKSRYVTKLVWKYESIFSHCVDSERAIRKSLDYLTLKQYKVQPSKGSIDYDIRYPWLSPNSKLDIFRKYWEDIRQSNVIYDEIKNIVCLEPLIILVIDGEISNFPRSYLYVSDSDKSYTSIVLKDGFAYGTRMPYDVEPRWFSPDMDIAPRPVEIDRDGIGHIKVPWGELLMERHEDQWRITAPR